MALILKRMLAPYMAPAGDEGSDMGGTDTGVIDRGDDFTPTDDEKIDDDQDVDPENPDKGDEKGQKKDDEEEDEKEEKAEEKKSNKREPKIPVARHKELLERERQRNEALARELAQYKGGQQIAATNDRIAEAEKSMLDMEKAYNKALINGDTEEASKLMSQIRSTERAIIEAKAEFKTQAAEARAYERVRYDMTVERLEAAYPVLNPDHDDYDEEVAKEVVELQDAYRLKGLTPAAAAQKAVKVLLGAETTRQERAITQEARVKEEDVAKKVAAERKAAAVKKAVDTSGKTPPSTTKVGVDSDKMGGVLTAKDIMKMNQDQFAKLSEADLARLRGDDV